MLLRLKAQSECCNWFQWLKPLWMLRCLKLATQTSARQPPIDRLVARRSQISLFSLAAEAPTLGTNPDLSRRLALAPTSHIGPFGSLLPVKVFRVERVLSGSVVCQEGSK